MKQRKIQMKIILLIVSVAILLAGLIVLALRLSTRTYADYVNVTFLPHLEDNAIIDGDIDCRIGLDKERLIDSGSGIFRDTLRDGHFSYLLTKNLKEMRVTVNGEEIAEPVVKHLSLDDEITVTFTWNYYPLTASFLLGNVINTSPSSYTFTIQEEIDRQHYIVDPTVP